MKKWSLEDLNEASVFDAAKALRNCCASRSWVQTVVAGRPFDDLDELLTEAERAWWVLDEEDWLEAFAAHPRLGDSSSADDEDESTEDTAEAWSREEQQTLREAGQTALDHLSAANQAYEERFGFVYLVDATGKSIEELLDFCLRRLGSATAEELRVAAGEQSKITRRRLEKMLS